MISRFIYQLSLQDPKIKAKVQNTVTILGVVKELINHGSVDVNMQDEFGLTPMYDAASWGYYNIIDILAKAGADPDIGSIHGATPVHAAASYGYTDTVKVIQSFIQFQR